MISMPPPVPVPAVVSMVDSVSLSSQEVSETLVPASSSHRQGAETRKVKRIRSGKRKIRGCEAGYERRVSRQVKALGNIPPDQEGGGSFKNWVSTV